MKTAEDMRSIIQAFLGQLYYLSILKDERNASILLNSIFELGRHSYIYPDYKKLFTEQDRKIFKHFFPTSIIQLLGWTPILVNIDFKSDINIARERRSQLWFLKNEITDLYMEFYGCLTPEIENSLQKLIESDNILEHEISVDDDEIQNNMDDIPNLTGVPTSHYWWIEQHRKCQKFGLF